MDDLDLEEVKIPDIIDDFCKWRPMELRILDYLKQNHIELQDLKDHSKGVFRKSSFLKTPCSKTLEMSTLMQKRKKSQ